MNRFERWFFNYEAHHGIFTIYIFILTLPYWLFMTFWEIGKEIFLSCRDVLNHMRVRKCPK